MGKKIQGVTIPGGDSETSGQSNRSASSRVRLDKNVSPTVMTVGKSELIDRKL